jgi:hypothetical protein
LTEKGHLPAASNLSAGRRKLGRSAQIASRDLAELEVRLMA